MMPKVRRRLNVNKTLKEHQEWLEDFEELVSTII